ncbi:MAG: ATP-dependent zinc metalloprotease FtsH [Dehalococcoidales bacterium]|jgi:cell division protease FtsH|nr:ATP-dependent zinc metalloprotease FtsH [Dehalococcoidales bacterium]
MRNTLILIAILIAAIAIFYSLFPSLNQKTEELPISDVIALSQQGQIKQIEVNGNTLTITRTDNTQVIAIKESNATLDDLVNLGLNLKTGNAGNPVIVSVKEPSGINWGSLLINLILPVLFFGGLLFFLFRSARGANNQAMRFGRSRARLFPANKPTVTFDDVAGVDEAKQELHEVVEFLKDRDKFQSLGARIPKGVLLVGPPGTGKTLLARAVAGEAGVPFFSISGSEFVEMFVGVGASRVRDLFDQAKRNAPCIVFIDEIDAVGRQRGAGLGGSHDEREQTLNQILVEMDGFDTNTSVIVLAATNRPDILDPALLRPGRFDRRVVLDRPDINGRLAILKVHAKGKPLAPSANLEVIAKATPGFSGADLANLVNEAAILAARRGKKAIEMIELEESIDRVIAGPERKSRRISPREKEITAYHEAGHALVARMLPHADPVHKMSIVARGMAGGYTRQLPTEDRYLLTRSQFDDMLATLLGGRTAELVIFNETSTGASDDIKRATDLARRMVTDFGMSETLGPRTFGHREELIFLGREISEQRDYSEKTALMIDAEVHKLIDQAAKTAWKILTENRQRLIHLAQTLIAKETLEGEELEKAFNAPISGEAPQPVTVPSPVIASQTGSVAPAVQSNPAKPAPGEGPAIQPMPAS